jgi:hypothetical protein
MYTADLDFDVFIIIIARSNSDNSFCLAVTSLSYEIRIFSSIATTFKNILHHYKAKP